MTNVNNIGDGLIPLSGVALLRQEKVDENDLLEEATESMKIVEEFITE